MSWLGRSARAPPVTVSVCEVVIKAAVSVRRMTVLRSFHHENCGSVTEEEPSFSVRANSGDLPLGLRKRIVSRKDLGRSSVPQSSVARTPAKNAIEVLLVREP